MPVEELRDLCGRHLQVEVFTPRHQGIRDHTFVTLLRRRCGGRKSTLYYVVGYRDTLSSTNRLHLNLENGVNDYPLLLQ